MTMASWSWIADAVLAVLLLGTLGMAVKLDQALRVVRRDRGSFEALITNLGSATSAVKSGIQALRHEADRSAAEIERRSQDAEKMATDLSFLIEAADRAGTRLEKRLQALKAPAAVKAGPAAKLAKLRSGGRMAKRRHADATATSAMATSATAADAAPGPADATSAAEPPEPAAAPDGLRELAGITTRRPPRAGDVALPLPSIALALGQVRSGPGAPPMKLVG